MENMTIVNFLNSAFIVTLMTSIIAVWQWQVNRKDKIHKETYEEKRAKFFEIYNNQSKKIDMVAEQVTELAAQMNIYTTAQRQFYQEEIKYIGTQCLEKGSITSTQYNQILSLHNVYHGLLGGNGTLDEFMAKINALEVKQSQHDNSEVK